MRCKGVFYYGKLLYIINIIFIFVLDDILNVVSCGECISGHFSLKE
ncbi:hypothetical protein DSUL_50449 [Desulfovibrionales bacterium]